MRSIIAAMIFLLLCAPAAVSAQGTIGLYFTFNNGQMHYWPSQYDEFEGYVYSHAVPCDLGAVEFRVVLPAGVVLVICTYPPGGLNIGDPIHGLSIAYWPPLNPGYNLLCTLRFFALSSCVSSGGTIIDAPIRIRPHPATGFARYTCRTITAGQSEYYMKLFCPLTSVLCPVAIAVEDKSWGSIKSLFGK